MDIDLLLILAATLLTGFIIGRMTSPKSASGSKHDASVNCSESYIQGLNFLLANKPDKAIELFVELIKVDHETMETHLALGNLFRSRGEVDRAIKIHQNLIARPNLDLGQRTMAIKELAEDYLKAGLLDRAENLYKELVQINPKNTSAHKKLLELYTLEKSWHEALPTAQKLLELGEPDGKVIVTHCLCELAEQNMQQGNLKHVQEHLSKAIKIDDRCIRAQLLLIDVYLRSDAVGKAEKMLQQLVKNSPQYIELYLKPAREIYLQRGSFDRYQQFLLDQYTLKANNAVALELLKSYQTADRHEALIQFMPTALQHSASLALYEFAFHYLLLHPQYLSELLPELSAGFDSIKTDRNPFVCQHCGYGSQAMQWHCPSCNSWSTIKPV